METKIIKRRPLGNPERIFKQDNFIISTFNGVAEDIRLGFQNLKEAHFNLVEFGWVPVEKCEPAMAIAEEVGIDILVQNWNYFGGFQGSRKKEIVDGEIQKFIEKSKKYKRVYGYYVWDEPYYPADVQKAAEQTDFIEKLDPERMPFSVAIPSYNLEYRYDNNLFDQYLTNFVNTIRPPVLSLDYYPFALSHPSETEQLDNSEIYKDLYLMRKLSLEKQMPLWFYYQGTGNLETCNLSTRQITMQVNLALIYGAKGIQHYKVVDPVLDPSGEKGDYYEHIKTLNRRVAMWGRTLMALTSTGVYHSDDVLISDASFRTNYCDDFKDSALFKGQLPKRVSLGEFTDRENNRYVMLLNRDYIVYNDVDLPLKEASRIYEVSTQTGKQTVLCNQTNALCTTLKPGEAKLYRIQDAKEEAYLIDYILEK